MLQTMRQNTKVILWITIIFFVLLIFLVWGADLQGPGSAGGPAPGSIGSVNGEPVPIAAYQSIISQNRRIATTQGRDLQPTDMLVMEEDAWKSVIDEMLLIQEAERRGLAAHDSEIRAVLMNDPPTIIKTDPNFLNEQGQFDINRYRQILMDPSTPENYLLSLEGYVRANLPLQKLGQVITSAAKVTDAEVREAFAEQNQTALIKYVLLDASSAPSADLDEAALQAYFEEHRSEYELPRRADLRYVTIPRRATAADSATLIQDLADFRTEALRAAAAGSDELTYSDFETLAMTFSDGPNAEEGGLSTGYLTPAEMTLPTRNAVTALEVGGISDPFLDGPYYHLVQLVDVKEEEGESRYQIRELALRISPSDSTISAVREQLDALRGRAQAQSLESAATEEGLAVLSANGVTSSGLAPGLASIPRLAEFALRNPEGTVSRVYETNSGWFLVEIAAVHEPGTPEFDSIRERVRGAALRDHQFEATRAAAEALAGAARAGDLATAAQNANLAVSEPAAFTRRLGVPGLGPDPEVVAAAFSLPVGSTSGVLRGSRGWVVIRVEERTTPSEDELAKQAPQIRQNLLNIKQSQIYNSWLEGLRADADIKDFRI